jgi:hypothetical protein
MDRLAPLTNAAIFPIIMFGAVGAALTVPIWMLSSGLSERPMASIVQIIGPAFLFAFPAFLIALLIPVAIVKAIAPVASSRLLRWVFFCLASGAIGFALPMLVGFMFPVPGALGAAAGVVGGVVCAGVWDYLERHPNVVMSHGDA